MAEIRVELQLADGSFTTGLLRAGQSLADFQKQIVATNPRLASLATNNANLINSVTRLDGANKGFLATLRDVSVVTTTVSLAFAGISNAMNGWFGEIIKTNAEMQRLLAMMRGMARTDDPFKEAAENVKYLREMAMNTPFSLNTLADSFVKLQSTGIDPMAGALQSLADGIAGFGGTDEQFQRATVAITQMSGKGVIQMEELRQQLGEHMPRAVELMARSMGVGIGELMNEIKTGTVAAKPALDALYAEFDRVYGGRAKLMMQTFDGQLRKTSTLWTNFVTTIGGLNLDTGIYQQGGFFDTITQQLKDLNEVLASPVASGFAASIGQGMTSVIGYIRQAIEAAVSFRRELLEVGLVVGTAFAMRAAITGITSLVGALGTLRNELKILKIEWAATSSWVGTGITGFRSLATAGTGLQMTMVGIGMGIRTIGTTIMTMMPWVAAIGLALYAAAEYFDIFGSHARNAYEDLKTFGTETRAQAKAIIDAREAQLQSELDLQQAYARQEQNSDGAVSRDTKRRIEEIKKSIEEIEATRAELEGDAAEREDQKVAERYRKVLDARYAELKSSYDRDATAAMQDIERRKANGDSIVALEKDRKEILYNLRKEQLTQTVSFLKQEQEATEKKIIGTDANNLDLKRQLNARMAVIRAELVTYYDQLNTLEVQGVDGAGIEHLLNADGGAKQIEKGEKKLADLRKEILEMRLQMGGATKATSEMYAAIQAGDFGSIKDGGEAVAKLHRELMATTEAKEALDELMDGRNDAKKDLERLKQQALDDKMDLLVAQKENELKRKLRPTEVFQLKLDNGYYKGLGQVNQIADAVDALLEKFGGVELSSVDAGQAIQKQAFGETTLDQIDKAQVHLARFNAALGQTQQLALGINFGGMNTFVGGPGVGTGVSANVGPLAGSNYMQRLIGAESSGSSSAKNPNSTATGIGQFIETTWLSFLDSMHPELANLSKSERLGLRNDNSYQLEAIDWYTKQNAGALRANGHQVTDANLYLSHFLGSGGANSVLGADPSTMLKELLPPGVLSSNPFLFGKTSGWIQQWAQGKFGTGLTADVGGAGGADIPSLKAGNTLLGQRNELIQSGVELTEIQHDKASELDKEWQTTTINTMLEERKKMLEQINTDLGKVGAGVEVQDNAYKKVEDAIKAGKLGESTDPNSREYEKILLLAQRLDDLNQKLKDHQKDEKKLTTEQKNLEEERVKINEQLAESRKKLADPDYVPESSEYQQREQQLNQYVEHVKQVYGEETSAYQQAVQDRDQILNAQRQLEATNMQIGFQKETTDLQTSLMTQSQQRQAAMQKQLAAVDAYAQRLREMGVDEVEITRQTEEKKALIRQQYAQAMNPMQKQMQEWGDLQNNLMQASTKWMDSLAGGITDLIMGTGDLRSVINGIMKDMVNMLVKYMMSGMKGGGAKGGSGGGKAAKAGKAAKTVGVAHTGGILGQTALSTRRATAAVFTGASRYHTGGIVTPKLLPSEVPIIAQDGEGVFTKEQMAHLQPAGAGGQVISINSPITVNGSAGTPEQNADLAKKMRREMEAGMRSMIAGELLKQTKAGNMMNSRGR